jgi:hypothetical protein
MNEDDGVITLTEPQHVDKFLKEHGFIAKLGRLTTTMNQEQIPNGLIECHTDTHIGFCVVFRKRDGHKTAIMLFDRQVFDEFTCRAGIVAGMEDMRMRVTSRPDCGESSN